ncbi:uracil-DNA glycosylase [Bacillus tianshenii]|uniref:uracil-DNA glycosylase n=1 Tax=Sutcliffiella tianshenii TaxID=1463404 RepID=UPI001CD25E9E|nr:uracil-DNA glycosylase [Bacillus tianshenii]MCA1320359.1 uracil-DNA glycosylase [Bacillus tianshenii]
MEISCENWSALFKEESEKDYYNELNQFINKEYESKIVYPPREDLFRAFRATSYEDVKVVIIGQDPYHGRGQAHGMSFSVQKGVTIPPSLRNMYKELQADLGIATPNHGYLMEWADEGVLLLNTVLTVRESEPNSHKGKGWERLTDAVISKLNERSRPVIFLLWGKHAEQKEKLINNSRHYVIKSPHPSPFSANRGFFGSRPFSKVNGILKEMGEKEIDWQLTP